MKRFKALLLAVALVFTVLSPLSSAQAAAKSDDIVILYTNDVHCAVGGEDAFGYANIAAYKKAMQEKHNYVTLVDAGDHAQGEPIGVFSQGIWLAEIMNEAGYDYATFGNHEFDYTVPGLMNIIEAAEYEYLSCNFKEIDSDEPVASPYEIVEYGDVKVAFIGITTPETFSKSTPTYFKDEDGEYIYSFCEGGDGQDLYDEVQKNIDEVIDEGADYVVAIAHLGQDPASEPWTSIEVIENTTGLTAVIDGHSHSTVESKLVESADGSEVLLTQTGTKFTGVIDETSTSTFGKLVITSSGKVTSELIGSEEAAAQDADVLALIAEVRAEYDEEVQMIAGSTKYPLYVNDPLTGSRLIRSRETNAGDFVADAYRMVSGADIGVVNGGGIRADIPEGEFTIDTLMKLHPFGNELCVKETTGQKIADLLEVSVSKMDAAGNNENGGFQHVSGLTFTADLTIPSSVETNVQGEFVGVNGERRVKNIQVLNSETGKYEPLKLKGTYTIASHNYMLKDGGDGLVMFQEDKLLQDCVMKDYQVVLTYLTDFCDGMVPEEYSDPYGQGRITLIMSGGTDYTVKAGDTVGGLAWRYGVTVDEILAANPGIKNNMIYAGKTIVIPTTIPENSYVVVAGDTLGKIAQANKTTVDELVALNNIANKNLIYAGQLIILP